MTNLRLRNYKNLFRPRTQLKNNRIPYVGIWVIGILPWSGISQYELKVNINILSSGVDLNVL